MCQSCQISLIVAVGSSLMSLCSARAQLTPRTPLPKSATITKPTFENRLTIKFRDDLKVRAVDGNITSLVDAELTNALAAKAQFALTFEQLIQLPQETLDFLESRASQRSGVAQPDLAGITVVHGPEETMELAAKALLAMAEIEWVRFAMLNSTPPCEDILPEPTPNYFSLGLQEHHDPNPGLNMTCAWVYGARGQGIQVADLEFGYISGTEDLCNINNGPDMTCVSFENHGTAVLGEIAATGTRPPQTAATLKGSSNATMLFAVREPSPRRRSVSATLSG